MDNTRPTYHVAAKVDGTYIRVSTLISRAARPELPQTTLEFKPVRAETSYQVIIYWKSDPPNNQDQIAAVEKAVLTYCARLFEESAYTGPVDCCL